MAEKKRVYLYDNLKFVLIMLVVVGHAVDLQSPITGFFKSIFLFIYTFHMPLFIFIAGHFHKNTNIRHRVVSFVMIGFAMKIVLAFLNLVQNREALKFSLLADSQVPWYMFATAAFIIISYLTRDMNRWAVLLMFIAIGCFVGYDSSVGDYLYLSRIVIFYPFYLLGEITSEKQIQALRKNISLKVISLAFIVSVFAICFFMRDKVYFLRPLFTGRNPFKTDEIFEAWGCLYRLLCFAVSALACYAIVILSPGKRLPFISDAGKKTLQVYFWHLPLLLILQKLGAADALCVSRIGKLVWLFIAVLLTVVLCSPVFRYPTQSILTAFGKPKCTDGKQINSPKQVR